MLGIGTYMIEIQITDHTPMAKFVPMTLRSFEIMTIS